MQKVALVNSTTVTLG